MFVNLVPVFAAILAVALINEPFALFHAVALVLVIGGIWLAQRAAGEAHPHTSRPVTWAPAIMPEARLRHDAGVTFVMKRCARH